MVQYRRSTIEGGTYFFTVVTHKRNAFLTSPEARKCLKYAWSKIKKLYPFTLHAFCLLPDHMHCIWTLPEGDAHYSMRWQGIKGLFSKEMNRIGEWTGITSQSMEKKREAGYFQRRFWEHTIIQQDDFNRHFDYIHFNPVKHGFVDHPEDYPWSTYHRYLRAGVYDRTWGGMTPDILKDFTLPGE